ncbi:MAG: YdcF family protein [Rhodospirillales bacterium]
MTFAAAKLVGFIADPANLILLLFAAAAALWFTPWRRLGGRIAALGVVLYLVAGILPAGDWLLLPLEDRFPRAPPLTERIDGVVVLGGMIDPQISSARGQPQVNESADRLTAMVELARRFPQARLVFTGGSGLLFDPLHREADYAAQLLPRLGVPADSVLFERNSRDTHENAVMTAAIVRPQRDAPWLLVTSARHMPRAVGAFRAQGWRVVPWPVDYATDGKFPWRPGFNASGNMRHLGWALHEWLGLAAYRLTGRSDSLFPGP